MKEIMELLNNRWITRRDNPETYNRIKDKYGEYKEFFREKLGYNIIIKPLLIKAEKIPGKPQTWMGLKDFHSKMEYIFLCLVLMFLEEMDTEEQFVLFQVTDYIRNQYPKKDDIDWTIYSQRKSLIKVLRFCVDEKIIIVNDGDDHSFSNSSDSMEVLYENTGLSKYFMRRFAFDIFEVKSHKDIEDLEWQTEEKDRGVIRRHRVYRRLVMEPVVYQDDKNDQDYLYIKNQRSVIEHDMEKYLDAKFHLHKNGALVLMHENGNIKDTFPNRKNISDIILQVNTVVRNKIYAGELERDFKDRCVIADVTWEGIIQKVIEEYSVGWSKLYREMPFKQLKKELNETLMEWGMLDYSRDYNEVFLLPVSGKMVGNYSKAFWDKQRGEDNGKVADQ